MIWGYPHFRKPPHVQSPNIFFTIFTPLIFQQKTSEEWTNDRTEWTSAARRIKASGFPPGPQIREFLNHGLASPSQIFWCLPSKKEPTKTTENLNDWSLWPEIFHVGSHRSTWAIYESFDFQLGEEKNADRPERKIITFRVTKKMIWTWCQICPHRTWGCNQWINGFLQNKNHQEWKDVKSLSYLFEPTKFKGFLKLDKYPHSQDCWCASANYITLWLKKHISNYKIW